jgi:hypothetical protein
MEHARTLYTSGTAPHEDIIEREKPSGGTTAREQA